MWNSFPIQTTETPSGIEGTMIDPSFKYTNYPEVQTHDWKDCPKQVKQWCLTLWKDVFGTVRDPVGPQDIVGYIPSKATIVAKYGKWIGDRKSKHLVVICFLYVDHSLRGKGIATKMIHTIGHECGKRWGPTSFLFESDTVPSSLSKKKAVPLCTYHYGWIPFIPSDNKWKEIPFNEETVQGFHGSRTGYRMYQDSVGDKIVFDFNDDIVWYTNLFTLRTFNGFLALGAFCRFFTPWGGSALFAHNMFYTPTRWSHYLL